MKKKKKPTHGGARSGAGRHSVKDKKVGVSFAIRESKVEQAREIIRPIVERINAE